jgi:lipoprotein-anchoring transpeptidase ErfK/SrfK
VAGDGQSAGSKSGSGGQPGASGAAKPAPKPVDPATLPVEQRLTAKGGEFILTGVSGGARYAGWKPTNGTITWAKEPVPGEGPASVKVEGDLITVMSQKQGAPQYTSFQPGPSGLTPVNWYERHAPQPAVTKGPHLLVNKYLNALWYFEDGKLQKAYRVTTGRQTEPPYPNAENYRTNYFTPEGVFTVTNYVVNPAYNSLNKNERNYAGGEPGNPLGTRWMGFSVFKGDGANIWGIHGTSHPELMGTWNSDGCIRMYTAQAEELFAKLAKRPAALKVISGR